MPHAIAAATALLVALLVRLAYARRFPYDTDEAQHLHVVWGWLTGQLPYRDFFDNHAPLFHICCAPLLGILGERSDILFYMRLAMFPLYGTVLLLTYRIGRAFFGARVALWSAVLLAVFPFFFVKTLEYRADDLWGALWVAVFWVIANRPLGPRSWFVAGVLIGAMLAVSLKTTFLLLGFGAACGIVLVLAIRDGSAPRARVLARCTLAMLAGVVLIPGLLLLLFILRGAWQPMLDCLVRHNLAVTSRWMRRSRLLLLPTALACWWQARSTLRRYPTAAAAAPELLTALSSGLGLLFLWACWPLLDEQDYIPVYPFVVLFVSSVLLGAQRRVLPPGASPATAAVPVYLWVPCLMTALVFASVLVVYPPQGPRGPSFDHRQLIADVLRYTDRDDPVADRKGETIYRRRPMWYVLETVTRDRLAKGRAADDIAHRLVTSGTAVAVLAHYTPAADPFIRRNYLPVSRRFGVAGRFLAIRPVAAGSAVQFQVEIPATYAIVADGRAMDGTIDGQPFHDARRLDAGIHWFRPATDCSNLTLVWAKAFDRGYRPDVPNRQEAR